MRKALLVALLATVVLVAGCTSQDSTNNNEPTDGGENTDSPSDGENVVRYTSSGFSPDTIRISQGESVTWVNDGGPGMWVASDVHPTHTEYDGTSTQEHCPNDGDVFDQCDTGSEYTFTFDKTGEWTYHNHARAAHTGTVIVE